MLCLGGARTNYCGKLRLTAYALVSVYERQAGWNPFLIVQVVLAEEVE